MEDNYNENGSCGCRERLIQAFSRETFSFSRKCYGEYSQQTVGIPIDIARLIQILISKMLNSDRQLIERGRDMFLLFENIDLS